MSALDQPFVQLETSKFMFKFERSLFPSSFRQYFLYITQMHSRQLALLKVNYCICQDILPINYEIQLNLGG